MIETFHNEATEDIFNGKNSKAARSSCPFALWKIARRKLHLINVSRNLIDLRVPPSNFLEQMKGDRAGQYSIRINDQYRICFIWCDETGSAREVEIVDYH
jgi:toxin HigB-1